MLGQAQAFTDKLGEAEVIDTGSRVANKNINAVLSDLSANVKQLLLLAAFFKTSDPDFVAQLKSNARINNSGVHHSGVQGVVTNGVSGEPVKGAIIQLEDTRKQAASDITGNYQLIKVASKTYNLIVSAPGCETQSMIVKIVRGKVLSLNFSLQKSLAV